MRFEDVLLALVSRHPRSGYELKKWLDVEGIFLRANADPSQIYRTLKRLNTDGLIEHEVVRKSGPDAKIFRISQRGADHLRELAAQPYEPPARWQEADLVARLSLLGPLHPSVVVETIDVEIAYREEQIRRFRSRDRSIKLAPGPIDYDPESLGELTDDLDRFGRESTDRWLEWLRDMRAKWQSRAEAAPPLRAS